MADSASPAASVIAVVQLTGSLVSLTYEYLWGLGEVPNDLEQLVSELQSLGKILAGLRNYIQADQKLQHPALREISGRGGPLWECSSELKGLQVQLESAGRSRGNSERLKWPLSGKEVLLRISRVRKHKSVLSLALQAMEDQSKLSKAMEAYVQDAVRSPQDTDEVHNSSGKLVSAIQIAKERRSSLDWLYPEDFERRHLEISGLRHSNTGEWLIQAPAFQKWIKGNSDFLLWGRGIGDGLKSWLWEDILEVFPYDPEKPSLASHKRALLYHSSKVIDHLKVQAQVSNYGVAYVYFDYMERDQQRSKHVLASLVKQLACQTPSFSVVSKKLQLKLKDDQEDPTFEKLYTTLLETSKLFNRVFLVFDGLDECDQMSQRTELLPLFHRLIKDNISVFITSRLHPGDIQRSLHSAAKIDLSAKNEDIKLLIQQKMTENPRAKHLGGEGQGREKIVTGLAACVNGVFLLIPFYIDIICQQPTVKHIFKELEKLKVLPTGKSLLDSTYDRVISKICKQDSNSVVVALNTLSWLTKAQRTLTVDELRQAVSVEAGRYELEEWDLPDVATLLGVCSGLITIDENSNTARLAHYTVQEYILRDCTPLADAGFRTAVACTTYLSFRTFSQGACKSRQSFDSRLKAHPFFEYAAKYLSAHIRACDLALTTKTFLRFTENPGNLSSYVEAIDFYNYDNYPTYEGGVDSPLHVACFVGHLPATRLLLEKSPDSWSSLNRKGRTALHEVGRGGHIGVAELLLKHRTDQDKGAKTVFRWSIVGDRIEMNRTLLHSQTGFGECDGDGKSALHWAARRGNKEIVKLLLENGAEIYDCGKGGQTALHEATRGGHEELVRLLLENSPNVWAKEECGQTPLHEAAWTGHKGIVQLLLEYGARSRDDSAWDKYVSVRDNYNQTALHLAAQGGHNEIVQLLLENGADTSAEARTGGSYSYSTALHRAAYRGYKDAVHLLLENGASVSTEMDGQTALFMAATGGHEEVVQLLLENGADISTQDKFSETLYQAAKDGHKGVVQLLFENGPNISTPDKFGGALYQAAQGGHKDLVQLLLQNSVDPDILIQGKYGPMALSGAASGGHKEVVQLLLENGVDLSVSSALSSATQGGHEDVVRLLLDKGADISARNQNRETALHQAAYKGYKGIVQLLLDNGTDISAQEKGGETALHKSAYGARTIVEKQFGYTSFCSACIGHEEVAGLLFENGADISVRNERGQTVLHLAAEGGRKEVVQLFLEKGADVSAQDKSAQTALHKAARKGHKEAVQLLLDKDADIAVRDQARETALFLAARGGHKEVVHLLLGRGADISEKNGDGQTVFFIAVGEGHKEVVQLLLENGVDISERGIDGQTAFFLAAEKDHSSVVQTLLKNGADISEKNKDGQTAFFLAVEKGNSWVAEVLLENGADISEKNKDGQTALFLAADGYDWPMYQLLLENGADSSVRDRNGRMAFLEREDYEDYGNDPWEACLHGW